MGRLSLTGGRPFRLPCRFLRISWIARATDVLALPPARWRDARGLSHLAAVLGYVLVAVAFSWPLLPNARHAPDR